MENDLRQRLEPLLVGRVKVLGVGNRMRGDDAAGSSVAERVGRADAGLAVDAGEVPENHLERICRERPDTVLVIDAADFRGTPGEIRVLDPGAIPPGALSTHGLTLASVRDYLTGRGVARVRLVGIQPLSTAFGAGMCPAVGGAVDRLSSALVELLHRNERGSS
jgi:hydrogenase 3 maturation protease